jgi:hypothetical protein
MGNSMVTLAVISVANTMPVSGARTTPVKKLQQFPECLPLGGSQAVLGNIARPFQICHVEAR